MKHAIGVVAVSVHAATELADHVDEQSVQRLGRYRLVQHRETTAFGIAQSLGRSIGGAERQRMIEHRSQATDDGKAEADAEALLPVAFGVTDLAEIPEHRLLLAGRTIVATGPSGPGLDIPSPV